MLQQIQIYKAGLGSSIIINELTGPLHYPVEEFIWHNPTKGDDLPNAETAGRHDRYADVDVMPISMQGHFLADTTTQYWTIRQALLGIVIPDPVRTYRYHSRIQIKLDGDANTYYADVILKDADYPLQANYPTVTPFQFQWECNFGYWRNLATNAAVEI